MHPPIFITTPYNLIFHKSLAKIFRSWAHSYSLESLTKIFQIWVS